VTLDRIWFGHATHFEGKQNMAPSWTHLIRFIAEEDGHTYLGQIDASKFPDVGLSSFKGESITARVINGTIYDGVVTDRVLTVSKVSLPSVKFLSLRGMEYRVLIIYPSRREDSFSHISRTDTHHPLHWSQLPRPCERVQYAYSRPPGSLHQAPHSLVRTISPEDRHPEDCPGRVERLRR
jgi:hypothetical protein